MKESRVNSKCLNCKGIEAKTLFSSKISCWEFDEIPDEYLKGEGDYEACGYEQEEVPEFNEPVASVSVCCDYDMSPSRDCTNCKHYDNETHTCPAFPEGSPVLLTCEIGHDKVYPGQNLNDIVFELNW